MNNKEYKEQFREYENINASPELKKRLISIAVQKADTGNAARKIVIAGSIAAAVLICTVAICTISIFNKSSKNSDTTAAKVISETETETDKTDSIKTVFVDSNEPEKVPAVPEEQAATPRELKMVLSDNTVSTGNYTENQASDKFDQVITEPVYNNVEEQPIAKVADAGITAEDTFYEQAYSDEVGYYQDDITWEQEPSEEWQQYEEPVNDMPQDADKDHDTYVSPVDYDPMLFNDKERAVYENCDHEWVTVVWPVPGATEHIECSKCGVMLNQWLYNGYTE